MRLSSFRIQNFRSITDSGDVDVRAITALLVEDLLDPRTYERLVRESYQTELQGKTLNLNAHIPRIAKRVEAGLSELGIPFHKTRPARLLLKKMAADPTSIMDSATVDRFEKLFRTINMRLAKHRERDAKPFRN